MKKLIKSTPVLALIALYFWAMADEFGFVVGLHLTFLASSFFILFTPITSFLYLLGFLPGAITNPSILSIFSLHILAIVFNVVTVYTVPVIYNRAFVCKVLHSILTTFPANFFGISFTVSLLLYHFFVSRIRKPMIVLILHLLGLCVSFGTFYFVKTRYNDNMVWFMVDMSCSNY